MIKTEDDKMIRIDDYGLFLFDFDGLLVNTEEIHYRAYQQLCSGRGLYLPWTFEQYCFIAHYSSEGLEQEIYALFPHLKEEEPNWKVLYREKAAAYKQLLERGEVALMPGASSFLKLLQKGNKDHAVVTHSSDEHVAMIREQHAVLKKIPYWITREDYSAAKPDPECYRVAIERLSRGRKAIGFEDTPRGLKALLGSTAKPVLITPIRYPEIPAFLELGVEYLESFDALLLQLSDK